MVTVPFFPHFNQRTENFIGVRMCDLHAIWQYTPVHYECSGFLFVCVCVFDDFVTTHDIIKCLNETQENGWNIPAQRTCNIDKWM